MTALTPTDCLKLVEELRAKLKEGTGSFVDFRFSFSRSDKFPSTNSYKFKLEVECIINAEKIS